MSTELYVEVLRFYAGQMALLDSLDLDGYADTFTEDGVTHHVHRGQKLEGRGALLEHARAALPRYREVVVRHWNDNYRMEQAGDGSLTVAYGSLVTLTDKEGQVRFESTYAVTDVLVRVDGRLRTRSRTLLRDRPAAA
ncbi:MULTISPECIES: nuclear transport factor 2 family protein [unclassified Streptomyces]|uniref:nuclear transport factor 2 family protein n=1 Tax=unclassified Streptomyces TaxID=2593676 RepID=UPI001C549116|nr:MULTISPECIES: nuclear transport factor 2 family protein [unclassified Streptomyces]